MIEALCYYYHKPEVPLTERKWFYNQTLILIIHSHSLFYGLQEDGVEANRKKMEIPKQHFFKKPKD